MEVHAHTHTPRKKWTHYFWEFLMLFLAITLGFFVENWREHRIEHKRAREYAKMLKTDLVSDTQQLKSLLDTKDSIVKEYDWLIRFYSLSTDKITFHEFDSTNYHGINLSIFASKDATYTLLKNSGNLRLFNDTATTRRLGKYEADIREMKEYWSIVNSLYGGMSSEHQLRTTIISKKFLDKNQGLLPGVLLKDAGYDFDSWEESAEINKLFLGALQNFYTNYYPELKKTATELILLLDKEYHLSEGTPLEK